MMQKFYFLLVLLVAIVGVGCGKSVDFGIGGASQSFTQNGNLVNNTLDILWVVDNSSSMTPLQNNLTSNFSSFISTFQAKGYDFKMVVTTTDAYLSEAGFNNNASLATFRDGAGTNHSGVFVLTPSTPNLDSVFVTNASQGVSGSGDERAFSSFRDAMNSPTNAGFLRTNSFFAVIILSDEDDFSGAGRCEGCGVDHDYNATTLDSVSSYISYLDTLTQTTGATRRYNVNAITVLDNTCLAAHQPAAPSSIIGQRYVSLVGQTNGVTGSICDASFANSLNKISSQITVLSTQFFLNRIPQIPTITVVVNGVSIPQDPNNGWTYNSAANSIQFHGTATPPQGATINIGFTPVAIGA